MGLILDSSVLIAAERASQTVTDLLEQTLQARGDQEVALASVALVELAHGIYRATTPERRNRREEFVQELLRDVSVYPLTPQTALLAGKIDGEQQAKGITIPFPDLLIGVTALTGGFTAYLLGPILVYFDA